VGLFGGSGLKLPEYQILLKQEMLDRKRINSRYSARAMARDLELSAAFFSQLMNGKRALSDETAESIARRLNWNSSKRRAFVLLVQIARAKSPELKSALTKEFKKLKVPVRAREGFRRLNLDSFSLISEWYHYALLELTEVGQFQPDVRWIAKRFRLPAEKIKLAVERLIRVGLLSPEFKKLEGNYRIGDIPSLAIRNYHHQMLRLADFALENQGSETRDFSSCTMALDPRKIPQARELIREFQKELMELMEGGEKTAVYQMSMQLFRLDKLEEDE
jgi:uncharacterized protein (TIGR02147 family)